MTQENSIAAVLQVLAITVLVDDKVHPSEADEFSKQLRNLSIFTSESKLSLTKGDSENWFSEHWKETKISLNDSQRDQFIETALNSITDEFLIPMLYAAMCQLCHCDNELHAKEIVLLKKSASIWGLD